MKVINLNKLHILMNRYLFQLGRQPRISTAELEAVFCSSNIDYKIKKQEKNFLILEAKGKLNTKSLIHKLGGIIKIAEKMAAAKIGANSAAITNYLKNTQPTGKIIFSINNKQLALTAKKKLREQGRNARYLKIQNTATILHNNLISKKADITLFENELFITKTIQPIEELNERDYSRPGSDGKSGMLPPKLARIMINLAQQKPKSALFDPFCGSGTILMEAAVMGYTNLMGSDISDKAIKNTKKNLEWAKTKYKIPDIKYSISKQDARQIGAKYAKNSVNAIITEPYLGEPLYGNEQKNQLKKQAEKLKKLYINAFENFYKILRPSGIIMFIFPSFKHKNTWITTEQTDKIKKIGFQQIPFKDKQFLRYHRGKQHIARDIYKFQKK